MGLNLCSSRVFAKAGVCGHFVQCREEGKDTEDRGEQLPRERHFEGQGTERNRHNGKGCRWTIGRCLQGASTGSPALRCKHRNAKHSLADFIPSVSATRHVIPVETV